jgi:hypothetical protein
MVDGRWSMGRTRRRYVNSLERAIVGVTAAVHVCMVLAVIALFAVAQIEPYRPRTPTGWLLLSGGVALTYGLGVLLQPLLRRDPFERGLDVHLGGRQMWWMVDVYLSIRTLLVLGLIVMSWWIVISRFNLFVLTTS